MSGFLYGLLGALLVDAALVALAVGCGPRLLRAAMRKQTQTMFAAKPAGETRNAAGTRIGGLKNR